MGKRRCREGFVPDENGFETAEMSDAMRAWLDRIRASFGVRFPQQARDLRPVKDVDVEVIDVDPKRLPGGEGASK